MLSNSFTNDESEIVSQIDEINNEFTTHSEEFFIDSYLEEDTISEKDLSKTNLDNKLSSELITINAELENYVLDDTHPYSWIDATGGSLLPLDDDDFFEIPLPFSFPFYDGIFDTIYVSSNGWLSLSYEEPYGVPEPFPSPYTEDYYAIAPFGSDLLPADNIFYLIEPDRVVVEYLDIDFVDEVYAGTFEVILNETGEIIFQYDYLESLEFHDYVCGLNYGYDLDYFNAYYDLIDYTDDLAISFEIFREEHDLEAELEAPYTVEPSETTIINATVTNIGSNDETDVELSILIDGIVVANEVIPSLLVDATEEVQYSWLPSTEGEYKIEAYATPVFEEDSIDDNNDSHNCTVIHKTWTIMYYLDGDVNLEFLGIEDFNELERGIAAAPMVNVIVLFDRHPDYDTSNGDWSSTRLYEVVPDFDPLIQSNLLIEYDELNMGDPTTLTNFINYCFQYFPADNYMLNLWDHGGGIDGICWDETDGYDYLTIDELQTGIEASEILYGQKIDIVSTVACLMNMMEVAYELRDLTDFFIGSEEVMYNEVVDWEDVLNRFGADPTMTPGEFAYEIVDSYADDWSSQFIPTHYSAINTTAVKLLETALNDYATLLETIVLDGYAVKIGQALDKTLAFYYPMFIDFIHFIENVKADTFLLSEYPDLLADSDYLIYELTNAVVNNFQHTDFLGNANGISIFMPYLYSAYANFVDDYITASNDYAGLDWLINCYWDEFLDTLYTTGYLLKMNTNLLFTTGNLIYSSPAFFDVDRDTVPEIIFGSSDGYLYCIDTAGAVVWSDDLMSSILSSPTITDLDDDGTFEILIGTENYYLYCYSEDGTYLWKYNTGGEIYPNAPVVADVDNDNDLEIIVASLNGVHCLNHLGGQEWTYSLGAQFYSTPVLDDLDGDDELEIFIGGMNGTFHCIDASGSGIWTYDAVYNISSSAAIADLDDDGTLEVVFANFLGEVFCLDHLGHWEWTSSFFAPNVHSNLIIFDIDDDGYLEIIYGAMENIFCLDNTGSLKWNYYTPSDFFMSSPTLVDLDGDGKYEIFISSYSGYLYCLASDGSIFGVTNIGSMIFSTGLILDINGDGVVEIILGTSDWEIIYIDLPDLTMTYDAPIYSYGGTIFRTGKPDIDGDFIDEITEDFYGINPNNIDTDSDGLTDWEELIYYYTDPNNSDSDSDGLTDGEEVNTYGTDPNDTDTDNDDMPDEWEVDNALDPLVDDADDDEDSDGLDNYGEYLEGTDPNDSDTDGDGLEDGDELDLYYTDPTVADADLDSDSDGLTNVEEVDTYHTDPLDEDTDDDTLSDGDEVNVHCTDPCDCDTDGDGLGDCEEVTVGADGYITDPNDEDTDNDGLTDSEEIDTYDTDPTEEDTDGDGILDGEEVEEGTDGYITDPNDEDTDDDEIPDGQEIEDGTDPTDPEDPGKGGISLFIVIPMLFISMIGIIIIRKKRK